LRIYDPTQLMLSFIPFRCITPFFYESITWALIISPYPIYWFSIHCLSADTYANGIPDRIVPLIYMIYNEILFKTDLGIARCV